MISRRVPWLLALLMIVPLAAEAGPACNEPALPWLSAPAAPGEELLTPAALDLSTERRQPSPGRCYAQADCAGDPPVACSGSGGCVAVDRNCGVDQRGFVLCDGQYTYCGPPCPCPEGYYRSWQSGCCGDNQKEWYEERCTNGEWVFSGYYCWDWCSPPWP